MLELRPSFKRFCKPQRLSVFQISEVSDLNGGRTRARTWDPLIKSQLLYQLSYAPGSNRMSVEDGVV